MRMRNGRQRGFFSLDAMAALALLGVLATAMLAVVSKNNAAAMKLAESRQAARAAEKALVDLQTGHDVEAIDGADVRLRAVDAAGVPAGMKWACVSVRLERGSAELLGLVPASTPLTAPPATSTTRGLP